MIFSFFIVIIWKPGLRYCSEYLPAFSAEVVFHILLVQDIVIIVKKRSPANFGLMTKHSQNLLMKAQHELLHILELSTGTAFG